MGKYKGFSGAGMNTNKNVSNVVKQTTHPIRFSYTL